MTAEQRPQLEMSIEMALCSRHGEPFRKGWPTGVGAAMILLLETIQGDEQLGAECAGDVTKLPARLLARPACERVPRGRLLSLYIDAKIGVDGRCIVCGRRRLGTEYQRTVGGRTIVDRHVCFDCVLDRMAPVS